jgi:U3 small nucleolar RNA-associated protein 13
MGLQIASSSVDGVVKIWNLKKQVCVSTIEMHDEKIWALDVRGKNILTGGGDSTIKIWEDCSSGKELEDKEAQLQRIHDEQKLSHLIRE